MSAREATFYTCLEVEELTCVEIEEAVEEYLDYHCNPGETVRQTAERMGSVSVTGYAPKVIEVESIAANAVEYMLEHLDDEYSNPDGDQLLDEAAKKRLEEDLAALLTKHLANVTAWQCDKVSSTTVTAEQAIEMVGEES